MVINCITFTSKILTDLCFTNQRIKTKNTFVGVAYSVLVVKMLTKHKEDCLNINGVQSVKVEKGTTEFKNCFNKYQLHLKFILSLLKFVKGSTQKMSSSHSL